MIRFREVLRSVSAHHVDFIVVGGISAVLHGAPVNTLDLDIVHSRDPENIARLLKALALLKPAQSLASKGHQLLITRFGPVDVLGMIGNDLSYEHLLPHTSEMSVTDTLTAQILDLETPIETKEGIGTEKDRAALPILKRTLEERRSRTD